MTATGIYTDEGENSESEQAEFDAAWRLYRDRREWESLPAPIPSELRLKRDAISEIDRQLEALRPPAPVVVAIALDGEAWKTNARQRAAEIIRRQRVNDLYPSQENLGDEIATEFRTAGIVGTDGKPISGAYIKRHALNGISSAQGKQLSTRTVRGK